MFESWTIKKVPKSWCFQTVLEKTLASPLDSKEIKPVNSKGNQPWIFVGRTDAEAEAPILWPLMWRANSLEKTLMLKRLKAWGEGGDRGWDGWTASSTQQTWVWVSSRRWWRAGKPGVLQSMGSQSQKWLSDWTTIEFPFYFLRAQNRLLQFSSPVSNSSWLLVVAAGAWLRLETLRR